MKTRSDSNKFIYWNLEDKHKIKIIIIHLIKKYIHRNIFERVKIDSPLSNLSLKVTNNSNPLSQQKISVAFSKVIYCTYSRRVYKISHSKILSLLQEIVVIIEIKVSKISKFIILSCFWNFKYCYFFHKIKIIINYFL